MQTETIVFGGGCFWCTEAVFLMIKGVQSVTPGYAGTPKVKVVKIVYDPDQVAFPELLQIFFNTSGGTDIFYTVDRQRQMAEHYIKVLQRTTKPVSASIKLYDPRGI